MPQIVEVLKYVHEISEINTLGVAMDVDAATYEQKYMLLVKDIRGQMDGLLIELRRLRGTNPALRVQIEAIEGFLAQLDKFILAPRIVEVPKIVEKVVEKDRVVQVPKQDERSLKMELSLSLLVEKLIIELKRIKKENPRIAFDLEDDVRLIFFPELDGTTQGLEGDLSGKLKAFSDSVNKKFESLGPWSLDHQLMLNSFLQERFLMANLVKSANAEIEKSKTLQLTNSTLIRKGEADAEAYRGYLNKLRTSLAGTNPEVDSIIANIFREIDSYSTGRFETTSYLGDLKITDIRIQSLIREKDAELGRLREELMSLNKLKSTINNTEAHNRAMQVIQEENAKLKTEINALRVERGSSELMASYKQQIQALNDRIHELEQEKSNLKAELLNLKNEYEVRLNVQNFNNQVDIKKSSVTDYNDNRKSDISSASKINANMTSPVQKYNINSGISSPKDEGFGIKMVDSKIEPSSSTVKTPTYGGSLTDSKQSGSQGSTYGVNVNPVTSTYQTPSSSYQGSSVSGNSGVYGTSLSGSGVKNAPTYQQGSSSGVYQPGTYQGTSGTASGVYQSGASGSGSGVYQSGTGSGIYQSGTGSGIYPSAGTYQAAGSSGAYQSGASGTYQGAGSGIYQSGTSGASNIGGSSGTYQPGTYQSGSSGVYQAGGYQGYQSTTGGATGTGAGFSSSGYQSSTYRPTTGTTSTTNQPSSQYSSSYRYEKK